MLEVEQTRVVHCKREQYDIYIGRPARGLAGSIWANPFHIGKDGTRDEVIEKYRQYVLILTHNIGYVFLLLPLAG